MISNFKYFKFNIKYPKQEKILVYGNNFLQFFLKKEKFKFTTISDEIFSILILLKIFFKNPLILCDLKSFKLKYFYESIKIINPKLIITYQDNDIFFYKLKNEFKSKKFIAIQNGYRFKKDDLFDDLIKKKNLSCDYIFCFGDAVAKEYKKIIKTKTISHGSLKNNLVKVNKKKNNSLIFISSYGLGNTNSEHRIIPILSEYCEKRKLKLEILLRTTRLEELNFFLSFKQILKKNIIEKKIKPKYFYTSYNIVDKAKINISLNGTLGYESLARGNKTFFINTKDRDLNCRSFLSFAWPLKFKKKGVIWENTINKKNIFKKLDYILQLNNKKWTKLYKKYIKNVLRYDYKNKLLVKTINKFL